MMNKLFGLLLLVLVLVGSVGFFRGWFSVSSGKPDAESSIVDVNLTVDPDKFESDKDAVKDKVRELTNAAKDEVDELISPE
jgi:hypothetical protein